VISHQAKLLAGVLTAAIGMMHERVRLAPSPHRHHQSLGNTITARSASIYRRLFQQNRPEADIAHRRLLSPSCHVWTAPSWQELSSRLQQPWSSQSLRFSLRASEQLMSASGHSPPMKSESARAHVRSYFNSDLSTHESKRALRAKNRHRLTRGSANLGV
jgi:hypothetical protein